MKKKWLSVGAGVVLTGVVVAAVVAVKAVIAGPSMSSAWLSITINQDECVKRGSSPCATAASTPGSRWSENSSIYGERGDYTALVRCAAEKGIVYFVVAGPKGDICSKHMNAIRDGF